MESLSSKSRVAWTTLATSAVVLAVALVLFAGLSGISNDAGFAGITPRFYPTVIACLLTGLALCLAYQAFRPAAGQTAAQGPSADYASAVWVLAGLLLSGFLIERIGFVISSSLLFMLTARGFGSRAYAKNFALGLVICLPVFWAFTKGLNVSLPKLLNTWI